VKMAFKVFNNWNEAWDQWKTQLLAAAQRLPLPTSRLAGQQRTPPRACFKCNQARHWAKTALHLTRCQDPVHDVARVDTGGWLPSLSLQGRSLSTERRPHGPLGPGGRRLMWPWDLGPLQDHLGGAQGNQVAGRPQSPTCATWLLR
jgi:hypothetical protein